MRKVCGWKLTIVIVTTVGFTSAAYWNRVSDPIDDTREFVGPYTELWGMEEGSGSWGSRQTVSYERLSYLRDEEERMIRELIPAHGWNVSRPGRFFSAELSASFTGISPRERLIASLPLVGKFFRPHAFRIQIDLSARKRTRGATESSQVYSSGNGWTRAEITVEGRNFDAPYLSASAGQYELTPTSPVPGVAGAFGD